MENIEVTWISKNGQEDSKIHVGNLPPEVVRYYADECGLTLADDDSVDVPNPERGEAFVSTLETYGYRILEEKIELFGTDDAMTFTIESAWR